MWLRKIQKDKPFFVGVVLVLLAYLALHVVRLEALPLYLFPMYSNPEYQQEVYPVYQISSELNGSESDVDMYDRDYRKYTYITNTLKTYKKIKDGYYTNTDAAIFDKLFDRLAIPQHSAKSFLVKPHQYDPVVLDQQMKTWLQTMLMLKIAQPKVRIDYYSWQEGRPVFSHSESLLE